jgi:hypothetical protein
MGDDSVDMDISYIDVGYLFNLVLVRSHSATLSDACLSNRTPCVTFLSDAGGVY